MLGRQPQRPVDAPALHRAGARCTTPATTASPPSSTRGHQLDGRPDGRRRLPLPVRPQRLEEDEHQQLRRLHGDHHGRHVQPSPARGVSWPAGRARPPASPSPGRRACSPRPSPSGSPTAPTAPRTRSPSPRPSWATAGPCSVFGPANSPPSRYRGNMVYTLPAPAMTTAARMTPSRTRPSSSPCSRSARPRSTPRPRSSATTAGTAGRTGSPGIRCSTPSRCRTTPSSRSGLLLTGGPNNYPDNGFTFGASSAHPGGCNVTWGTAASSSSRAPSTADVVVAGHQGRRRGHQRRRLLRARATSRSVAPDAPRRDRSRQAARCVGPGPGPGSWRRRSPRRGSSRVDLVGLGPGPDQLWRRAHEAIQAGQWDRAEAELARLGRARSPTPEDWMLRAQVAMARGRVDEALADLAKIPDAHELAPQARLRAGQLELRRDRLRAAEEAFRAASRLDPDLVQAHRELIYIYGMQGRRAELDAQFRALAKLTPLDLRQRAALEPDEPRVVGAGRGHRRAGTVRAGRPDRSVVAPGVGREPPADRAGRRGVAGARGPARLGPRGPGAPGAAGAGPGRPPRPPRPCWPTARPATRAWPGSGAAWPWRGATAPRPCAISPRRTPPSRGAAT